MNGDPFELALALVKVRISSGRDLWNTDCRELCVSEAFIRIKSADKSIFQHGTDHDLL